MGGKGFENGCTGTPVAILNELAGAEFVEPSVNVCGGTAVGPRKELPLVGALEVAGPACIVGSGIDCKVAGGGTSKDACG